MCVRLMAIICPSTVMHHLLLSCILLFFSCYVSNALPVYGAGEAKDGFHSTPVSSLLPKNKCTASAGGGSEGLPITQKYGPCSSHPQPPRPQEIFGRDESRVSFINSKFNQYTPEKLEDHVPSKKLHVDDGNFLVDVGFGTPPQNFKLTLDTGSSLTWIQCKPCVQCLNASHFDPPASSTYRNGSCIPTVVDNNYNMTYADESKSIGKVGCDTLTLEPSDVFHNFTFGCGTNNEGDFGSGVDGMLGLGQGNVSTVSQTASKFNKVFSYCLPEEDSIGSLLFGEKASSQSSSLKFTSLVNGSGTSGWEESGFYFVKLLGISVANQRLNIPSYVFASLGTIIDSGTVITRLPQPAYSALKAAFKKAMEKYSPSQRNQSEGNILDTCYDLRGNENVLLPEIVLHFGEGTDVGLNGRRILWGNDASHLCLAFAGNSKITIIGNTQQVSMTVLYDIQGGRIGFGASGCSK